MAAPAILKIEMIADAAKATRALDQVGTKAQGTTSKLGGLAKIAGTAFATAKVIQFGRASVDAALESEQATARLAAVFAATGETTGVAAKQAEKYAAALSKKIAVDDESIMAAQAQLVSFAAVSNETARAAGIFDRATAAAADLAAAGFGSLDSNSVALGKALQDPTKGITALARSGVTFTKQQKEQIAAMQKSGDLLGAQKVVLAAVEGQVKGTAEATATSSDKMTLAFGETQEAIGAALLPVLESLAPLLEDIAGFIQDNAAVVVPLIGYVIALAAALKAWQIIQSLLNITLTTNPIGAIIIGVTALIAIIVVLVKNWGTIKAALAATFDWLKRNWPLILAILTGPFGLAVLAIVRNWDTIKNAAKAVFDWLRGAASAVWQFVGDQFRKITDAISGVLHGVGETARKIAAALTAPINAVIRGWNDLEIHIPEFDPLGAFGPSVGGQTIRFPNLPLLAQGGSVLRTGLAIVHAGEQFSGVGRTIGGSTVINVSVTTTGLGADSPQIQRAVVNALRGYVSRNGALDVPVRSAG